MLKKTPRKNIKAILDYNRCGSLAEINEKESISLDLYCLSGYLNLAEFTRGAVVLRLYNSVPQKPEWKNLWWQTRQKEELKIANQKTDLVELDATSAGDFGYWMFNDNRQFHFIKSIKFRHPNQVFKFGIGDGFCVQNESLRKIIEQAKIQSRNDNTVKYRMDESLKQFHENLYLIIRARDHIGFEESEMERLYSKIDELKEQIKVHQENKKGHESQIQQQLGEISKKSADLAISGSIRTSDIELLDNYWNTVMYENNDSGDQAFSYKGLSQQELDNLKIRNKTFYANQK
ncbi:MAG: hypothetical protein FWE50_04760 [Alphaproteobacteria bacterium]|nr:hypothetical protein [Alphaproteobacteria bacterium]